MQDRQQEYKLSVYLSEGGRRFYSVGDPDCVVSFGFKDGKEIGVFYRR